MERDASEGSPYRAGRHSGRLWTPHSPTHPVAVRPDLRMIAAEVLGSDEPYAALASIRLKPGLETYGCGQGLDLRPDG